VAWISAGGPSEWGAGNRDGDAAISARSTRLGLGKSSTGVAALQGLFNHTTGGRAARSNHPLNGAVVFDPPPSSLRLCGQSLTATRYAAQPAEDKQHVVWRRFAASGFMGCLEGGWEPCGDDVRSSRRQRSTGRSPSNT